MNINFERIRLQMHLRQLYEALGAHDAELLIADAWQREMARHDKIQQQSRAKSGTQRDSAPSLQVCDGSGKRDMSQGI